MATPTYIALATTTLSSSASSVTFSSIPATYRDLVLVVSARSDTTGTGETALLQFNGDTGANYSGVYMVGRTTSPTEASGTLTRFDIGRMATSASGATNFGLNVVQIMDYSASKHKTGLSRGNSLNQEVEPVSAIASRWANTDAITSIVVKLVVGTNFVAGSTFSLYGIEA